MYCKEKLLVLKSSVLFLSNNFFVFVVLEKGVLNYVVVYKVVVNIILVFMDGLIVNSWNIVCKELLVV